jgi:hypothetical protein
VVTAFTVETYQHLQADPVEENTRILMHLSRQMADASIGPVEAQAFHAENRSIRVNVLWFISLVLSLSAALIALMGKQWIREYQRETALSPLESIRLRELRHEGFVQWGVIGMLESLPVFLQIAVILFFVGVMDLLWGIDSTVASLVSLIIGIVILFMLLALLAPVIDYIHDHIYKSEHGRFYPCPYRSPQALSLLNVICFFQNLLQYFISKTLPHRKYFAKQPIAAWTAMEGNSLHEPEPWPYHGSYLYQGLLSVKEILRYHPNTGSHLFQIVYNLNMIHFTAEGVCGRCQEHRELGNSKVPNSIHNWWLLHDILDSYPDTSFELTLRAMDEYCSRCHGSIGNITPMAWIFALIQKACDKGDFLNEGMRSTTTVVLEFMNFD